jgi:hypothetical protein
MVAELGEAFLKALRRDRSRGGFGEYELRLAGNAFGEDYHQRVANAEAALTYRHENGRCGSEIAVRPASRRIRQQKKAFVRSQEAAVGPADSLLVDVYAQFLIITPILRKPGNEVSRKMKRRAPIPTSLTASCDAALQHVV